MKNLNHLEHLMFVINERTRRAMLEFDALKTAVERLTQAYRDEVAKNATLTQQVANPPAADPAPADVAALTTEITDALNPPASPATPSA